MSSLSYAPYGKILDYWYEKLKEKPYCKRFLLTKFFEILAFKSKQNKINNTATVSCTANFPQREYNEIPESPTISIVIPIYAATRHSIQNINNLITSIQQQTVSPHAVIMIDDASPLQFTVPDIVHVYRNEKNKGPAAARNKGKNIALQLPSDIIAFTDSDCILKNDWCASIITAFLTYKNFHIMSGNTISYTKTWLDTYHNINGTLNGRVFKNTNKLLYGTTANLALSKLTAQTINFNEDFPSAAGEDIAFCFNANQNGFAIKYIHDMTIFHNYSYSYNFFSNLKKFFLQFQRYGQGENILLTQIPDYYSYFTNTEEIEAI